MCLSVPLDDSYPKTYSKTPIFIRLWDDCVGKWKEINPMDLSDTLTNYKTKQIRKTKLSQPALRYHTKIFQGVYQMVFWNPWTEYYLHNWINPPTLNHQHMIAFISTTVICALKQCKTLMKWTVSNDAYKSKYINIFLVISLLKLM